MADKTNKMKFSELIQKFEDKNSRTVKKSKIKLDRSYTPDNSYSKSFGKTSNRNNNYDRTLRSLSPMTIFGRGKFTCYRRVRNKKLKDLIPEVLKVSSYINTFSFCKSLNTNIFQSINYTDGIHKEYDKQMISHTNEIFNSKLNNKKETSNGYSNEYSQINNETLDQLKKFGETDQQIGAWLLITEDENNQSDTKFNNTLTKYLKENNSNLRAIPNKEHSNEVPPKMVKRNKYLNLNLEKENNDNQKNIKNKKEESKSTSKNKNKSKTKSKSPLKKSSTSKNYKTKNYGGYNEYNKKWGNDQSKNKESNLKASRLKEEKERVQKARKINEERNLSFDNYMTKKPQKMSNLDSKRQKMYKQNIKVSIANTETKEENKKNNSQEKNQKPDKTRRKLDFTNINEKIKELKRSRIELNEKIKESQRKENEGEENEEFEVHNVNEYAEEEF
ncbi:MAG: hypothetical protein MJ252_15035 [archaeon]|nr:hypothetical protein [archaeon]